MLDIQWSSEGKDYCIQSSHLSFNGNASYTVQLENKTIELTIANLPVMKMSNFTIGPCLFYDQLIMERKHTLNQYGTWTIFHVFDTICGSGGSWTTDMRHPAMSINATSTQGEPETTSTQGEPETTRTLGEHTR